MIHITMIHIMNTIFIINGIYDILCSLSILHICVHKYFPLLNTNVEGRTINIRNINIPLFGNIHLSMLKYNRDQNIVMERFLAYWIFTYGMMRIFGDYKIIAYSYYIEGAFLFNETIYDSVYTQKTLAVILSSLLLGHTAYNMQAIK